jgi:peroxiredoxin
MNRALLFLSLLCFSFAFPGPGKLHNKKMPAVNGKTISGITIDSAFFSDKVTLITFMYIGCPPCMKEIPIMNKLNALYKDKPFNLLCISPHIEQHLKDFNADNSTNYSIVRKHAKVDSITYNILPECNTVEIIRKEDHIGPECNSISKLFNITSYPTSFLVDKNGVIKKVWEGFEVGAPDDYLLEKYTSEIDKLLE